MSRQVPARWLPFVAACASGAPAPPDLQERASTLVVGHEAHHRRRLARSLDRRKGAAAGRTAATGARRAVREAVVTRADGACESCGAAVTSAIGVMDHFFGRARSELVETCWLLCATCDAHKTNNRPSRRWWLERFLRHATRLGLGRAIPMVHQQLALEPAAARSASDG